MAELVSPGGRIKYVRDDLGFPSIEAKTLQDGVWARGWFHAHDRLVQVQLMLAIASGRACMLMGDNDVARYIDRMTRVHRFTDDLDEQVAGVRPEMREILDLYAAGFNEGARVRGWPLLLRAAGIGPRTFAPRDVVLVLRIVAWFGLNQLVEMAQLITAELIGKRTSPRALRLLLGDTATAAEIAAAPMGTFAENFSAFTGPARGGSNAVAVAGSRSSTGSALLVADPHLEVGRIPPVLYAMHTAHANGTYLQGLHVPGFWYPSFGRNDKVAWTFTYGRAMNVDVRIVKCRRGEMYDGVAWRPLKKRTAEVAIRKRPTETWTFWDSELGTVIGDAHSDSETALPCVYWNGIRETYRDLDAGYALAISSDVESAVAANRSLHLYALDGVMADSAGRIAHILGGRISARNDGGVLPIVPDGKPISPIDEASRPVTVDPPTGWIASANARLTEAGGKQLGEPRRPDAFRARRQRCRRPEAARGVGTAPPGRRRREAARRVGRGSARQG